MHRAASGRRGRSIAAQPSSSGMMGALVLSSAIPRHGVALPARALEEVEEQKRSARSRVACLARARVSSNLMRRSETIASEISQASDARASGCDE